MELKKQKKRVYLEKMKIKSQPLFPNAKPSVFFAKSAKENPASESKPKLESEIRTKS